MNRTTKITKNRKEKKKLNLIFIVPFPAKKHYLLLQNNILYCIGKCSKLHVL